MLFGAFTGQSATVILLVERRDLSKDFVQVITGLSHTFDEALQLLGTGRILHVTTEKGQEKGQSCFLCIALLTPSRRVASRLPLALATRPTFTLM
jgi:hypothetical protein